MKSVATTAGKAAVKSVAKAVAEKVVPVGLRSATSVFGDLKLPPPPEWLNPSEWWSKFKEFVLEQGRNVRGIFDKVMGNLGNEDGLEGVEPVQVIGEDEEVREVIAPGRHSAYIVEQARRYMGMRGRERHGVELQVVRRLEDENASYEDVLLFMKSAASIEARAWASELIWQMRQRGELERYGHSRLSQEHIDWASRAGVDPRILAYCIEARSLAKRMIMAKPEIFYEQGGINFTEQYVDSTLPNPGYMAMLLQTETGNPYSTDKWAYVYVGDGLASQEINEAPNAFPNSNQFLRQVARHHQDATGLPYYDNWAMIPGSLRGNPGANLSGGAIGPQFMPINAMLFINKYNEAKGRLRGDIPDINLWDPYTGTVLGYMYIASSFYARHGSLEPIYDYLRPSYRRGDDAVMRAATSKWNPHAGQINQIMEAAYSYSSRFRSE